MAYRTEKDSLGEKKVPADAYYGIQTQRAVENYPISGYRAHPILIRAMGMIKKAAALANRELKLVEEKRAAAILQAAEEVMAGKLNDQFVVDVYQAGAGVSFHMNTNEVIANRAIEILGGQRGDYALCHPNDHVNFGQSTNDVIPTALRLAAILLFQELLPEMERLSRAFAKKGQEFDGILKSGRTHMQDAVPIRLGQEFAGYAVAVRRAYDEIRHAQDVLRELGIGGSAVGTGVNTHPRYQALVVQRLSEVSGQPLTPTKDMRWTMQSNLPLAVASSALRNYALELIRISNDLRLLASGPNTGFAEINLPALQPGSSIMPGKINPVIPELVAMVSFQAVGNDVATALAVQAGQLELNVMMPTMAWNVLHSTEILKNTTCQFSLACVEGITANKERCTRYAQSTVSLATALNPYIGYAKTAEIVKQAIKQGRPITEIALERKLLDPKQLQKILDPRRMTEPAPPLEEAKREAAANPTKRAAGKARKRRAPARKAKRKR
ncbi:MAG: aspartate ammonia-lyase [Acidobacteria bacterium RIFCSPHIGHO2_12_FULL_67_30]|nr:MAG: aspartate ammonia-lyase [Acidobacteria bacterium RIFCSPHIGHO2_12_FULL_67_30]